MGEGGTICKESEKLGVILELKNLFFKNETQNPYTNSFKDRVGALLISHAISWEYNKVICASNGNQGASIAAYASLGGLKCINIIPKEIDIGKRAQMITYGSEIIEYGDIIDDAILSAKNKEYENYYQCTPEYNPLTIEAQKSISFELYKQIGVPDWIVIPMGSGELLVSVWKGFFELLEVGIIESAPKLIGVQSQSSAPIVDSFFKSKKTKENKIEKMKSLALGTLVKDPLYKELAVNFIKKSKGTVIAIPERMIIKSVDELLRNEGIIAEPASALSLGGINLLNQKNFFDSNDKIVCLITASGLKVPYVLEAISSRAKTAGLGNLLSTKLKILTQVSLSGKNGIYGIKLKGFLEPISSAAVYQHLKELEQKDLITRNKAGKNVYYVITENGKKVLEALETLTELF
jgi:threonine synthase